MADALAAEQAGAFAVVLETIPAAVAGQITRALTVPTIGIGAGPECDGQILVVHDLLGLTTGYVPRHVRQYADLKQVIGDAVVAYCEDVAAGQFPSEEQSFK